MNTIALNEHIKQLRARDPRIAITFNPQQSAITILRGRLANPVNVEALKKSPYQYSRQFIRENRVLLGNIDESTQLDNERATTDRRGMTHVLLAQKHGNAQVWGGNLSVHYGADGAVYLLKSNLASAIDIPASPRIESAHATEIAKEHAGAGASLFEGIQPALVVADAKTLHKEQEGKKYYLCWQLGIILPEGNKELGWIYFVDALEGKVIFRYSSVQTGTGTGHYSHGTTLNSEAFGTTYRLRDTLTSSTWPEATKPIIHTYDDHRVAMCFSLAAFNPDQQAVRIEDPKCVAKTFPDYFEALFSLTQTPADRIPVICIDGPTASGKGTLSSLVAERLGYHYLDSGALYRVTAFAALQAGLSLESSNESAIATMAEKLPVRFEGDKVLLNDQDVTDAIRSEEGGMKECAAWLKTFIPELPIAHVPAGEPFWTL